MNRTRAQFSLWRRIASVCDAALLFRPTPHRTAISTTAIPRTAISRTLFRLATFALVFSLCGCSLPPSSTRFGDSAPNAKTPDAQKKIANAKESNAKLSGAKSKTRATQRENVTLEKRAASNSLYAAWFRAWQNRSQPTQIAAKTLAPLVFIDTETLAHRLPSWRLADSLAATPTKIAIALPNETLPPLFSAPRFSGNRVLDSSRNRGAFFPSATAVRIAGGRETSNESALQNAAQGRATDELSRFLRDEAQILADSRRARADDARATLEDDVLAARDIVLPPIVPAGLPLAVQLEITNLRLKLLPNSNTSAGDRAFAQARLFRLQEIWKQKLRDQETQLLDEWTRQRDEEPQRVRREGEAQIADQSARARRNDRARLTALREEQTRFLTNDFDALSSLGTTFPPFSVRRVGALFLAQPDVFSSRPVKFPPRFASTEPTKSNASFSLSSGGSARTKVALLRAQARHEAQGWANDLSHRRGWRLSPQRAAGTRDETSSALEMPNFS